MPLIDFFMLIFWVSHRKTTKPFFYGSLTMLLLQYDIKPILFGILIHQYLVQLQTVCSQDQVPHYVGPDLGSSLFASSSTKIIAKIDPF